jgi:tetratricopeptide (TPR) repeat protein
LAGYELLDQLGRGAMGVVWLAREKSLNRMVALKLMRTGSDPLLRQRLLREGHAAARLRHPNIVAVHAMGKSEEGAFLAMDYLEGGNLDELLLEGPLRAREAAALVAKIADALVCAHTAGVLHRDLKPSNILLDLKNEPHLADFGLAAPIEGAGDLTVAGEVAGTPAYLAPELLAGADHASVQSDIYGLGAVLYACLTGRPPFTGDSTAAIFAHITQTEVLAPRLLRPEVPRDLETICLKCLEKTPTGRYASARELLDDLGRFLRGEAIAARPVGAWGKSIRWCRRRPTAATSIALGAALLLVLAVGGPIVAFRLERARRRADTAAASSRAVADFLGHDLLEQAAPENEAGRELTLRSVLDRASSRIEGRFPKMPLVEATLEDTLASTYNSLGLYRVARHHWERAYALRRDALGPEAPATVRTLVPLIDCLRSEGRLQDAVDLGGRTVAQAKRVLGPEDVDTLTAMASLGNALDYEKRFSESQPITLQVLAIRQRVLGPEHPDTILAMSNLAFECEAQGQYERAETLCRRALELRTRILGPDNPDTLVSMNNLGAILLDEGQFDQAAAWCAGVADRFRRVCGPEHPKTLIATGVLASALRLKGDYPQAEALYRSILRTRLRVLGPLHPSALLMKTYLGDTLRLEGRLDEAEAMAREAWEGRTRVLGPGHPDTLKSAHELALILVDRHRLPEAEAICRQEIPPTEAALGKTAVQTLDARDELTDILLREARYGDAEAEARLALAGWSARTEKGWQLYAAQSRLAGALIGLQRLHEAKPLAAEAVTQLRRSRARIPAPDRQVVAEAEQRVQLAMAR